MPRLPVRVVAYVWAAPATLVGLSLGALAVAGGALVGMEQGVIEFSGGRVLPRALSMLGRSLRIDAMTLGHVVVARSSEAMVSCRHHERVHVRQYERWGLFFFPLYFASSALALARGGHPYRDNAFEKEAFGPPSSL